MKKLTAKAFLTRVKEYLVVTLAGITNAASLYAFVNPSKLIAGGFSGLSSVFTYVFYKLVPNVGFDTLMSIIYFILSVPLLICSLIFLRGDFTFKTIWATLVCTCTLAILPIVGFPKFDDAPLIAIAFGGILIGVSMYIAAENNGSNGGTEIIAKIVAKYHPEIDLSKVVLIANLIIMVVGSIVVISIEGESATIVVYSFLYILMGTTVFGMFKRGFNHPQKFLIVTTEYEQLTEDITNRFKRGCSCMDVKQTDPEQPQRRIVMVVVQHRQAPLLKQLIRARDPNAFTIVKEVYDVFSRPTFNRSYKTK